jgi:hypothetical protein
MEPDTDATPYASTFLAPAPKYFMTAAWDTKQAMAPAMKKAGTRQRITCSWAYHFARARDSITAPLKRLLPTGSQKKRIKPPTITLSGFQMVFQSMRLGCASSFSIFTDSFKTTCDLLVMVVFPNFFPP